MDNIKTQEYLKRQITFAPGKSQDQRERFFTIELVYDLHHKINQLEKQIEKFINLHDNENK